MKQEQQQKAREMYFQTNLSKTEIAEKLNVSRRSVFQWSVDGDWEKLRTSARCMPSMLAEKCYYLIGHFTDHLLSKESFYQSVTKSDVDILFKLTKTVNLLKKGSTVNENMETFTSFLEGLQARDAGLAEAIVPHIDDFVTARAAKSTFSVLDGFTPQGVKPFPEKEIMEKWLDEKEAEAIHEEMRMAKANTQNTQDVDAKPVQPVAPNQSNTGNYPASGTGMPHPLPLPSLKMLSKNERKKLRRAANAAKENIVQNAQPAHAA